MARGSTGQPVVHPAVAEMRQQRAVLGSLLGQLALPDEDGEAVRTPAKQRARKAARARWDRRGLVGLEGGRHGASA